MKEFFIRFLTLFIWNKEKRRNFRLKHLSYLPKLRNNRLILVTENGKEIINPKIEGLEIKWSGSNSTVKLYSPIRFNASYLNIGNCNYIEIQSTPYLIDHFIIGPQINDFNVLKIGKNFSSASVNIFMHDEPNTSITIGDDVMCSSNVFIWPNDGHSIYSLKNNELINIPEKHVKIGSHVWLCRNANIIKNAGIPNNTIVGLNAIVNSKFEEENTIIAGSPAKVVKKDIGWYRDNTYTVSFKRKQMKEAMSPPHLSGLTT